jgi:hypothetical protein
MNRLSGRFRTTALLIADIRTNEDFDVIMESLIQLNMVYQKTIDENAKLKEKIIDINDKMILLSEVA